MKGIMPWYIYAMLSLFGIGMGISIIIQGSLIRGGAYTAAGLLFFGASLLLAHHQHNSNKKGRFFSTQGRQLKHNVEAKVNLSVNGNEQSLSIQERQLVFKVTELLLEGQRAEAIRHYRLVTGADLVEAIAFVEKIMQEEEQ